MVMTKPPVCPSEAMERRAAPVLIEWFLLAALVAYTLVATAAALQIPIANPAVKLKRINAAPLDI
jgi:hypothetical protein